MSGGVTRRGTVRSHLEISYRKLVESTDLDVPEYNFRIDVGGHVYILDAFHRRAGIAIELDGEGAHGAGERFDTDRERDRHLLVAGVETVRLTDEHIRRCDELYSDLVELVGRRRT